MDSSLGTTLVDVGGFISPSIGKLSGLQRLPHTRLPVSVSQDFDNNALEANDGKPLRLYQKAFCGLTAGAIGECVGSPADLALIRMQAPDSRVFHILMTNIYSSKERWIERAETIRWMKKVGVAKDTGTSWIEM